MTGATMANFTALAAARHGVLATARLGRRATRARRARRRSTVVTHEGRTSRSTPRSRCSGWAGRATASGGSPPTTRAGCGPTPCARSWPGSTARSIVCAQAGNVNTGAFDPFDEIVPIAHERGRVGPHRRRVRDLGGRRARRCAHRMTRRGATADSWSTDAHKWLNVPYDSGLGVRPRCGRASRGDDPRRRRTTSRPAGAERDNYNWVPESSRRARGFAVLAALRSLGRPGLVDLIERDCAHARRMAERAGGRTTACRSSTRSCSTRSWSGSRARPTTPTPTPRPRPATRERATSSRPSSATGRAGSAGRRGAVGPRCGCRSRAGRPPRPTSTSRSTRSCDCLAAVDGQA